MLVTPIRVGTATRRLPRAASSGMRGLDGRDGVTAMGVSFWWGIRLEVIQPTR
ncbi:hypothetical protein ACFQX6_01195 [Streptosporangium lutulentum]